MTRTATAPAVEAAGAGPAAELLRRVCLGSTALLLAATVLAVLARWPAQFGGAGNPDAVAGEFLTRGTALAPPLLPLVLFAGAALLVVRRGAVGVSATVVLVLLGAVFLVGGVGEAAAPATPDVPALALTVSGVTAALLGAVVLVLGGVTLREALRERRRD